MRARIKSLENYPLGVLCCEQARSYAGKNAGKVLEIHGPTFKAPWECGGCGAVGSATNYHVVGQEFQYVGVESVDIEEGS